jgi:hypothetical protein
MATMTIIPGTTGNPNHASGVDDPARSINPGRQVQQRAQWNWLGALSGLVCGIVAYGIGALTAIFLDITIGLPFAFGMIMAGVVLGCAAGIAVVRQPPLPQSAIDEAAEPVLSSRTGSGGLEANRPGEERVQFDCRHRYPTWENLRFDMRHKAVRAKFRELPITRPTIMKFCEMTLQDAA